MTQSLGKALRLFEILASHSGGSGLSELARESKIPKGTAHRLLRSLVEYGYLEQLSDSRYIIGMKVVALAQKIRDNTVLIRLVRPYLEDLAATTNETINLAMLGEGCIIYLDEILSTQAVGTISKLGTVAPLHCTALGKSLLAFMNDSYLTALFTDYQLTKYTENTISSVSSFWQELAKVKKAGYAIDDIEYEQEKRCVAAPIIDDAGQSIAAISISGPFFRLTREKADEYGKLLLDVTQNIALKISITPRFNKRVLAGGDSSTNKYGIQ